MAFGIKKMTMKMKKYGTSKNGPGKLCPTIFLMTIIGAVKIGVKDILFELNVALGYKQNKT